MSKLVLNTAKIASKLRRPSKMAPAFTLYGGRGSSNTDRVRLTLAEGGFTDYELVLLDLSKSEQKSEENMKRHPWGKIPSIVFADGFTLYESRAISQYLARKYAFPLLPAASDAEATARFEQAAQEELLYFGEPAARLGFEKVAKRFLGLPADEAVVTAARRALEAYFDVAERVLRGRDHMAGPTFTLVDLYYVPLIRRLFACGHGDLVLAHPAVSAWWDRVVNRPAIAKLLAADAEAMAAAAAAANK